MTGQKPSGTPPRVPVPAASEGWRPPDRVLAPSLSPAGKEEQSIPQAREQSLQEHRRWLLGVDHESSVSFDKVLTTLSAGALGIAVNLGQGKSVWLWSLKLSWAGFTASLLAMLFSYLTSRRASAQEIKRVDWKLARGDDERFPDPPRPWHQVTTSALNQVALVCLLLGICLLIAFTAMNV